MLCIRLAANVDTVSDWWPGGLHLLTCHLNGEDCDLLEDSSLVCRCCSVGFVNRLWEMENCPDVGNNNKARFLVAGCSTAGSTERCRRKEGIKS